MENSRAVRSLKEAEDNLIASLQQLDTAMERTRQARQEYSRQVEAHLLTAPGRLLSSVIVNALDRRLVDSSYNLRTATAVKV